MIKFMPISKEKFETLPDDVKAVILSKLKIYDETSVWYANGLYHYATICSSSYAKDHKFIGVAYADDIYTAEERKANAKEQDNYSEMYNNMY